MYFRPISDTEWHEREAREVLRQEERLREERFGEHVEPLPHVVPEPEPRPEWEPLAWAAGVWPGDLVTVRLCVRLPNGVYTSRPFARVIGYEEDLVRVRMDHDGEERCVRPASLRRW